MPPNTRHITGRDTAVAAMRDFFQRFDMRIEYASMEIQVHGDMAFDRGTYSQTITPKAGGAALQETGNYLWLYRREPGGNWLQSHAIWNADQRPPTA
jgi:ketosteroid isomerase-like protein